MLTKVYLEGSLGRAVGREWELDINSAPEALQLIQANNPNMLKWIRENVHAYDMLQVICEFRDGHFEALSNETFFMLRELKSIHFVPAVAGAGGRVFKMIAGVALMVVGAICSTFTGGGSLTLASVGWSMLAGACMALGSSLVMSALIGKQKQEANDDTSYYFNGAVNTTSQGNAVPLVFGRCKVGSSVISSIIEVTDQ